MVAWEHRDHVGLLVVMVDWVGVHGQRDAINVVIVYAMAA